MMSLGISRSSDHATWEMYPFISHYSRGKIPAGHYLELQRSMTNGYTSCPNFSDSQVTGSHTEVHTRAAAESCWGVHIPVCEIVQGREK